MDRRQLILSLIAALFLFAAVFFLDVLTDVIENHSRRIEALEQRWIVR